MQQHAFDRQGAILLAQSDGCAVWQFRNDTGDGTMTTYEVFPGVMLSFNDFHMARFESSYVADRRLFAIDHCREGRMEYTQADLSRRFDIALTPMKACFRSVYGSAIGTWLTNYRMNLAAELLIHRRDLSIGEIGGRVGYDSAGKFAQAFRRVMKLTPSEYRKERGISDEI